MRSLILRLRGHWGALLMAIFVGLIMVGPNLVFIHSLGSDYRGLPMMGSDAETYYLARQREFCDRHSWGNPYIKEYANLPAPIPTLAEGVLALPSCITRLSIQMLNLLYKFLLPFIVTLLVYTLMFRLTRSRLASISGTALVMLGQPLINLLDIQNFIHGRLVYGQFLAYSRPVNPEFSGLFFWASLHILLFALRERLPKYFVFMGFLLGMSFYIYFYLWTFLITVFCVLVAYAILRHDWHLARYSALSVGVGVLCGLPILRATWHLVSHPWYGAMANISGLVHTHSAIMSMAGVITIVVFTLYAFVRKIWDADTVFLFIPLVASVIVINQQVLTGNLLQQGHYHWYFNTPIFIIALVCVISYIVSRVRPVLTHAFWASLILVSFAVALFVQYSSYLATYTTTAREQSYIPVLKWLDLHTTMQDVILAPTGITEYIPIYTSAYVAWSNYATYHLLPDTRRTFTNDYLFAHPSRSLYKSLGITYVVDSQNKIIPVNQINDFK